jgi:glycosyltransferase involved in cell wall biosynthesis
MKIAFDLRRIGNPGIGRYMKCLVQTILEQGCGHEFLLLLPPESPEAFRSFGPNVTSMTPRARYYSLREQFELPRILREQRVDLLHSPHFLLPLVQACPAVVTIHDVIYLACPQDLNSRAGRLYYSAMMHASARLAKRIITDSEFSKKEIVRFLGVDPEKVAVVYPAVDDNIVRVADPEVSKVVLTKHGIDRDYIFYTGIYKQRKNHAGLLRAFAKFIALGGDGKLVIAGPISEGEAELRRLAQALNVSQYLVFTGFVDDSQLAALYSAARVYACPSLYEGFGFTVLEAMACGVPVVSSSAASLPEVGGDAALYADAADPEQFGQALYQAFTDASLRETLTRRGFENVRRFSWQKAATACLEAYEQVVGGTVSHVVPSTNFG